MTVAEIRGKISDTGSNLSERMEDLLTSDIFGCMQYLPARKVLVPFLRAASSFHGNVLSISESPVNVRYLFWPWLESEGCRPCEPDVLLVIETEEHNIHLIVIEAKYYSGLSSEEDERPEPNDQLARELDNLKALNPLSLGLGNNLEVISRSLLFVTQDMAIPRELLARSLNAYERKKDKVGDIYWASWRFLPDILEKQLTTVESPEQSAVMNDMLTLLRKKMLFMFSGIKPVTLELRAIDFKFYSVTSQTYRWPNLNIVKPIEYTYKPPAGHSH